MKKVVKHLSRWLKLGLFCLGVFIMIPLILTGIAMTGFQHRHANEDMRLGVSFSTKYSRELGLDWKANYLALIHDMGVKRFRLMSYWDEGEPSPGKYNFDDLDFQMREAEKSGVKVSLAIGERQPRYPECHVPDWATKVDTATRNKALVDYITTVVDRYKNSQAIISYQLENEALNTAFGLCKDFARDRLVNEFKMVKAHDPNHPIIVSVSNEFGLPVGQPLGDVVGFSIYQRVYQSLTKTYFDYPLPAIWHGSRAANIEMYLKRPVMIHELQTEPWGPAGTGSLSIEEQNKSMDAKRLVEHVEFARHTGISEAYLWGGEWWYWRMIKFNDPSLWNAAKGVYAHPGKVDPK